MGGGQETTPQAASTEGPSKSGSVPFLLRQTLGWNKQLLSMYHAERSWNTFPLYDHMDLLKKQ